VPPYERIHSQRSPADGNEIIVSVSKRPDSEGLGDVEAVLVIRCDGGQEAGILGISLGIGLGWGRNGIIRVEGNHGNRSRAERVRSICIVESARCWKGKYPKGRRDNSSDTHQSSGVNSIRIANGSSSIGNQVGGQRTVWICDVYIRNLVLWHERHGT